jgi:hypothetical protein
MRHLALASGAILALCLAEAPLSHQVGEAVSLGTACSYFGERVPSAATLFSSDREAEETIKRIVDASGLTQNFDVRAAGVPNAVATNRAGRRLILYNQFFMIETREKTGTHWAPISILAHEVGHHLNGHTLDETGSRPRIELEADYYSGFILQKLGATVQDARAALEKLGSVTANETHPAKHDRLAAITNGWRRSCDSDPRCSASGAARNTSDAGSNTVTTPERNPVRRGRDSCQYARDGECDEPDLCEPGTDTSDCSAPRQPRREAPSDNLATVCVTPFGNCPLVIRGVKGGVCTCYTVWGPVQGIGQ